MATTRWPSPQLILSVPAYRVLTHPIVGSEGRFGEFDRAFNPGSLRLKDRWKRIGMADFAANTSHLSICSRLATCTSCAMETITSRSRALGQTEIDAHMIEIETNVPLTPDLDEAGLERKAAQSRFVEEIGLLRVLPGAIVPREASDPGTYDELRRQMDERQQEMQTEQGRAVPREEAVAYWYECTYLPQVEAMRRLHISAAFPRRTETNLFLSIMKHRRELKERDGVDPGPEQAVVDFMERFGPWRRHHRFSRFIRAIAQSVRDWLRSRVNVGARLRSARDAAKPGAAEM